MKRQFYASILILFLVCNCSSEDQPTGNPDPAETEIYFPPFDSDIWVTKSISELAWNKSNLQPLLDFLELNNTKSFIILHDGKMVLEEYMNDHDANKLWYWASAGKTLTTTLSGIAQDEGLLDIDNKVSDYIGTGWTSSPLEKENLITSKHLLSMNSGLDDNTDAVEPEDLQYVADAGTRWAYHNVYKKMQDVIAEASNQTFISYFNTKLRDKIGMTGAPNTWLKLGDFNVYGSDTRSMARFGLMIYAKGKWGNTQIISEEFLNEAINTSQDINKSYGYLWWLNGKPSYHLPGSQLEFSGPLVPNAPSDMYAALGKNDQKIYIVPSKKLVIVRMGNAADTENFALSSFDNDLWAKINDLID